MSSNLVAYLIGAITMIIGVLAVFGFPALAIVAVKYFKLKERELVLEMEYRERSQQEHLAVDQRVQRLEDALTSLDHDVRVRLGIDHTSSPLSRPELVEDLSGPDAPRGLSLDPSRAKAR
jgi:hypothetical protein